MRESQEHGQEHACDADSYQSSDEDPRRYGEPVTYESSHRSKDQNGNNGYGEVYAPISSRLAWIRLKRAGQVYLIREPPPYGSREAVHEQHDDDRCSYQRCHLRVVEEVHGDGDLLPNTPGPDRCKHGRQADVALLLVQREVKELMAWGSRAKRKL